MRFLLLPALVPLVFGFDYIKKALSFVDHNVDPCENFYRHACPIGAPSFLPLNLAEEVYREALSDNRNSSLRKFDIVKDSHIFLTGLEVDFEYVIPSMFREICQAGGNKELFLSQLEHLILVDSECITDFCLSHLSLEHDCEIKDRLQEMVTNLYIYIERVRNIEAHLRAGVRDGISEAEEFLNEMKDIAFDMIQVVLHIIVRRMNRKLKATPWARNNNVTELIETVAKKIHLVGIPDATLEDVDKALSNMENVYSQCKNSYHRISGNKAILFCFLVTRESFPEDVPQLEFYGLFETFTIYPRIGFGFMFYYMMQNSDKLAFKLGGPGFPLAHELSHSLIKSSETDILTYFSENASNCIKTQYQSFCKEYTEESCEIREDMADDNGADVLGLEIALALLHRKLDKQQLKQTDEVNRTNKKLFFYGAGLSLCTGTKTKSSIKDNHAPENVRINTFANHPDFKDAFQCADSSKMMRAATKHCSIYGADAPQQRRRLSPNWITSF